VAAGKRAALLLAGAALAGVLSQGCGVLMKENRVVLNALDRSVDNTWVGTPAGVASTLPLTVPLGTAGALADIAVTLPVLAAPQAACDAYVDIWKDPQGSDFRQAILFLPKVVGSAAYFPLDFAGSWLFRMRFDGCEKASR
jgi:hypothetical protein